MAIWDYFGGCWEWSGSSVAGVVTTGYGWRKAQSVVCVYVCVCRFLTLPAVAAMRSIWQRRASWCSSVWPWPPPWMLAWICRWCIHLFFSSFFVTSGIFIPVYACNPLKRNSTRNLCLGSVRAGPGFSISSDNHATGYCHQCCGSLWHF